MTINGLVRLKPPPVIPEVIVEVCALAGKIILLTIGFVHSFGTNMVEAPTVASPIRLRRVLPSFESIVHLLLLRTNVESRILRISAKHVKLKPYV